jgi:hypothetical protein
MLYDAKFLLYDKKVCQTTQLNSFYFTNSVARHKIRAVRQKICVSCKQTLRLLTEDVLLIPLFIKHGFKDVLHVGYSVLAHMHECVHMYTPIYKYKILLQMLLYKKYLNLCKKSQKVT